MYCSYTKELLNETISKPQVAMNIFIYARFIPDRWPLSNLRSSLHESNVRPTRNALF